MARYDRQKWSGVGESGVGSLISFMVALTGIYFMCAAVLETYATSTTQRQQQQTIIQE